MLRQKISSKSEGTIMNGIIKASQTEFPWKEKSILFLHNWRCAGSTFTSLLASNYQDTYIKIGGPFNRFGWPDSHPQRKHIQTLGEVRKAHKQGCIVGGHIFMGMTALLPGSWDVWMNARDPIERMRSGILRFHASGSIPIRPDDLMSRTSGLQSREDIEHLLCGPLRRESNGIARRLAGLTMANKINDISNQTNLERVSFLEDSIISEEDLFNQAASNLSNVRMLILSDYIFPSILLLEKMYGMRPLINPFSDLRHNSLSLGKATAMQRQLVNHSTDIIQKYSQVDMKLWPILLRIFQDQIRSHTLSRIDIRIREIIHGKPLIPIEWFLQPIDLDTLIKGWSGRLVERALEVPEIGPRLIDTVCSWPLLEDEAAERIHHISHKAFNQARG